MWTSPTTFRLALVLLLASVAAARASGTASATATLRDAKGDTVGEAVLTETPHGVLRRSWRTA